MTLPMHYLERAANVYMEQKTRKDTLTFFSVSPSSPAGCVGVGDEYTDSMATLQRSLHK
jgi:hypothetical protein